MGHITASSCGVLTRTNDDSVGLPGGINQFNKTELAEKIQMEVNATHHLVIVTGDVVG